MLNLNLNGRNQSYHGANRVQVPLDKDYRASQAGVTGERFIY